MEKREAAGLAIGLRFWSLMPWRIDASFDGLDDKADPRMCGHSTGWFADETRSEELSAPRYLNNGL